MPSAYVWVGLALGVIVVADNGSPDSSNGKSTLKSTVLQSPSFLGSVEELRIVPSGPLFLRKGESETVHCSVAGASEIRWRTRGKSQQLITIESCKNATTCSLDVNSTDGGGEFFCVPVPKNGRRQSIDIIGINIIS